MYVSDVTDVHKHLRKTYEHRRTSMKKLYTINTNKGEIDL